MNFDFSDDQRMLRDQARRFLDDNAKPRAILEGVEPFDRDLWKKIADLGWMGTALAEEDGGIGLTHIDLCVIAEELGRALAPVPFASSIYMAREAIALAGSPDQKKAHLPGLCDGSTIGCLATAEGNGPLSPKTIHAEVSGGKLTGTKTPVADGDVADLAVVAARSGGDVGLFLVDLAGPGVRREPVETVDPTRSHAALVFDGAPAAPLGSAADGWRHLDAVLDHAAVLLAFEQVGGAQKCLEDAKEYALNRYAFGRPIASFQAIKHKLADVYMKTELARSNAYYGAWALATNAPELPVAAAAARVAGSKAFCFAAEENIQTHGGMGFTWEFDCHLYLRRAKHLALTIGGERKWKDRLVAQLEQRNAA
ncbi:MAG: acyl-CoA/acyl-ACP dehydrogenase [Alphaproteobacteria bacterium]|nr:acyl-CoA/acyl-ACP dehydrogenase [Alphaproteobacteria bacterium]